MMATRRSRSGKPRGVVDKATEAPREGVLHGAAREAAEASRRGVIPERGAAGPSAVRVEMPKQHRKLRGQVKPALEGASHVIVKAAEVASTKK